MYRLVCIYKKEKLLSCFTCTIWEGRERGWVNVLSPCCSSLTLQLSADELSAVSTDQMWHLSLDIMRINHFPAGKPKPCVQNLQTVQTLEPWVSQYCQNPVRSAWRVVTLGNAALQWPERELQSYQPKWWQFLKSTLAVCLLENIWHFRGNSLRVLLVKG